MNPLTPPRRGARLARAVLAAVVTAGVAVPGSAAAASSPPGTVFVSASATVIAVGAPALGSPAAGAPAVTGVSAAVGGNGYYVLRADGEVAAQGAPFWGQLNDLATGVYATGIAVDPRTGGYWILASNGQVSAFHAPWFGQLLLPAGEQGQFPAAVGIAAATDGAGYYVLQADGTVRGFDAPLHGSLAGQLRYGSQTPFTASGPVTATGLAVDPVTGGYWVTTSTGGVFGFAAPDLGSPAAVGRADTGGSLVGIVAIRDGYAALAADGEVYRFTGTGFHAVTLSLPAGATAVGLAADPATGGLWLGLDDAPADGYLNPLRGLTSLVPRRIDQGVDFCGAGPLYPLGPGVVLTTTSTGWPGGGFISYRLTAGPATGRIVYVAESITPAVVIGQHVTTATVLGTLHDSGTCMETGWGGGVVSDQAAGAGDYNGANTTAYGLNFNALLQLLGAPPGLVQDLGPPGALPLDWPRLGAAADGVSGTAEPGAATGPPVAAEAGWVAAVGEVLLGGAWSPVAVTGYAQALSAGDVAEPAVVAVLQQSLQARELQVRQAYQEVLHAAPTATQLLAAAAALNPDRGLRRLSAALAASGEYLSRVGSSPAALVNADYQTFLHRPADPAGLSSWLTALSRGLSDTQLAWDIENSPEGLGVWVGAEYQQLLGRPADPAGSAAGISLLDTGGSLAELVTRLATSAEFFDRAQL